MTDFIVYIPARLRSTRLPDKPLADIAGKPMVVRVAERARQSGAAEVWIAADDEEVMREANRFGIRALLTRPHHSSGTSRGAEVVAKLNLPDNSIVVNVQGDEPLIDPELIRRVAEHLESHPGAVAATACYPVADAQTLFNPNAVKVVLDREGYAMYFTRAPVPYARDAFARDRTVFPEGLPAYRHIGIYVYRAGFLREYETLPPAPMESFESLEQLRILWHGYRISVAITEKEPAPGVDTLEDLMQVRKMFRDESEGG